MDALREAIQDGFVSTAMISADFFLQKGKITQAEFDELEALAYPPVPRVEENQDNLVVEGGE